MTFINQPGWGRRVSILLLSVGLFSACTSWSTVGQPLPLLIRDEAPDRMRITRSDFSVTVVEKPQIIRDTLRGFVGNGSAAAMQVAIPLADIRKVEIRTMNEALTGLVLIGLGVTIAAVAAATQPDPPRVRRPSTGSGSGSGELASCPLVYSWDGEDWRLDSGTFGGAFLQPLARTDLDNLDFARAADGELRLKLANEMDETDHVDALSVLAVDHAPGVTVAPDGLGALHALGSLSLPTSARDTRGQDALARVISKDGWNWESSLSARDPAVQADLRDGLELTFARVPEAKTARLVLDGNNTPWAAYLMQEYVALHGRSISAWTDSLNAHPELATKLGEKLAREAFLAVSVWTDDGWESQGLIWEAGPEVVKRQVFELDLSNVASPFVIVRLESAPSFWLIDHVAIDYSPEGEFSVQEFHAASAIDGRGQDVRSRLAAVDGDELVMETGDSVELQFQIPSQPDSLERTYLVRTNGWYQLHSAGTGEPDIVALDRVANEPGAISKLAIERMNTALSAMAMGASP